MTSDRRRLSPQALKRRFTGVSWQSPVARVALPVIDAIDRRVRNRRKLGHLPAYSIRIRGTGISDEFGGVKFLRTGTSLANSLIKYAGLSPASRILDIGSGAGRMGYSLSTVLSDGSYVGLDIDPVSVSACQSSQALSRSGFTFVHADLENDLYNDQGGGSGAAADYRLPFDDDSFDIVYLESVFTHLTDVECANYAGQILRVLKPGGRAVVSGFLRELGTGSSPFKFHHRRGDVWIEYPNNPRKAVAADTATFDQWFGTGHTLRLLGRWRGDEGEFPNGQDWLVYTAPAS